MKIAAVSIVSAFVGGLTFIVLIRVLVFAAGIDWNREIGSAVAIMSPIIAIAVGGGCAVTFSESRSK
jgi:hypothetical protein